MLIQLEKLTVEKNVEVINQKVQLTYCLAGECCFTDALWLKEELQKLGYDQQVLIDMRYVTKNDLIAVNALILANSKHNLQIIFPYSETARSVFKLTGFDRLLNHISTSVALSLNRSKNHAS